MSSQLSPAIFWLNRSGLYCIYNFNQFFSFLFLSQVILPQLKVSYCMWTPPAACSTGHCWKLRCLLWVCSRIVLACVCKGEGEKKCIHFIFPPVQFHVIASYPRVWNMPQSWQCEIEVYKATYHFIYAQKNFFSGKHILLSFYQLASTWIC